MITHILELLFLFRGVHAAALRHGLVLALVGPPKVKDENQRNDGRKRLKGTADCVALDEAGSVGPGENERGDDTAGIADGNDDGGRDGFLLISMR